MSQNAILRAGPSRVAAPVPTVSAAAETQPHRVKIAASHVDVFYATKQAIVDVSIEPTDGAPQHSGRSILRGTLTI